MCLMKFCILPAFVLFVLSLHCSIQRQYACVLALRITDSSSEKGLNNRHIDTYAEYVHDDEENYVNPGDALERSSEDRLHRALHRYEVSSGFTVREELNDQKDLSLQENVEERRGGRMRREEEEEEEEQEEEGDDDEPERPRDSERFVFGKPAKLIKTEAGELRITSHGGLNDELGKRRMGLGFLTLEPNALLLPHYLDVHWLFLVYKGRGRLSWVDNADFHEVDLEEGDLYKLDSGTVFHVYNVDEGQRLSIFSIFDTVSVFDDEPFHTFFLAGGKKQRTVLSGFDESILATAFKASWDQVSDVLSSQTSEGIMYSIQRNESLNMMKRNASDKPFNIYEKKADFSNDYGAATSVHEDDYSVLKDVNKGVFFVRLKAGALLAPHWNPRATEIALVTNGEGEIHVVYPNGTAAATERVQKGDIFYVPQSFPMCQIAARNGPFEFVGFSTSSRPNRPQFLAGGMSVLQGLDIDLVASSYNVPTRRMQDFLSRQNESIILPGEPLPTS